MCRPLFALIVVVAAACAGSAFADDLPSPAQVQADVRRAVDRGQVTQVEIDGSWKLEREAGYAFANVAKQAVIADKVNPDRSRAQFNALVIYQRGAPGDAWRFDRLFSYGFKPLDAAPSTLPDTAFLHELTLKAMRDNPAGWMPVDPRFVFRVDGFRVLPDSIARVSDNEVNWQIEGGFVIDDTQQHSQPAVKKVRVRIKVEGISHRETGEWILSKVAELSRTDLNRQNLTREQIDSLPTLASAPFDQLYFEDR